MSTMLINISKADFSILDIEDGELLVIHQVFGHSQAVGEAHYSLQTTNVLTQISHTTVMSMQRVSKHWHATIGQCKNCAKLDSQLSTDETHMQLYNRLLGPLKTTVYNAAHQAILSMGIEIINEIRNVATGMGNSILRGLQDMFGHYISVNPTASIGVSQLISSPHLAVDPNLLDILHPLFLGTPNPSFTSPYQVELVQSCLTNEHVLCVMPTGSGKSLAFFVAPLIHPRALFIVITPLVALTEDMARRLATTPIARGQYHHNQDILTDQIVIVSMHQAGTDDFFHWANVVKPRLTCVFINEAHHVITSDDYRNCFKLFHLITALNADPTFTLSTTKLKDKVVETHRSIVLHEKDRGIIYCTTIALIKELSELLQIPYYTSRLDDQLDESSNTEEKNRRFNA
ncbi:P-loop containing nucleoside triphosphate hydrolase protein [Suillus occidentalis]|nr:P-loop containing nucleoside triphosphate hydrolase protein [Suillus occidentalis]